MPIPDFQTIMLPLLQLHGDKREHAVRETRATLAKHFSLSEEELKVLLPSGRQPLFTNRVAWAIAYLYQAGLLERISRGRYRITDTGLKVIEDPPEHIDYKFLEQFDQFVAFRRSKRPPEEPPTQRPETPVETLELAYAEVRDSLARELLTNVKAASPQFFETLVVDLLVHMGYGGSRRDAGLAIGKSGDEGIDGIIKQDRLGLDVVYVQAKRWDGTVGRPEIQRFVGALQGQNARKGVFITTGTYSKSAVDYAAQINPKVVLIDGSQLAELMIDYNLAVMTKQTYEFKELDSDYFSEE